MFRPTVNRIEGRIDSKTNLSVFQWRFAAQNRLESFECFFFVFTAVIHLLSFADISIAYKKRTFEFLIPNA